MGKDYTPIDINKHGHKFYSAEDVGAGAVCDCKHCPKKAVKKEEKKE